MTASLSAPPRLSVVRTAPKVTPDPELTQMIASAKAMSARALSLQIEAGRVLGSVQALNKKQYAAEMVNSGLDKTQGNKLIAMAAAADAMPSADVAAFLSPHLLIQLGQKRNQAALDAITDDDTQLSVVEKIKKYRTPSAPKEKKSVRRVGNLKGGTPKQVIEVPPGPHVEEIYSDYEKSGTHVAQWLGGLVNRDHDSFLRSPEYSSPKTQVASAPEPDSELDVLGATPDTQPNTPSPAPENLTEQDVSQAELDAYVKAQAERIAPEPTTFPLPSPINDAVAMPEVGDELHWSDRPEATVTGINEEIPHSPVAKIESIKETSPTLPSSPPSTHRYKLGWREGDKVVANSVVQKSYEWAEGKPMTITSVEGKVGTIQTLNVIRHDGHEQMSFGNWVEEVPSESVALPSPHQPEATQTVFFEIGKTGDNWEGEIVQLVSKGSVHYHVKRLNDDTWTHILPKLLCEVSHESGVAARTALTEKVFKDYGLQVGDAITWSVEDIPLTGTIVHLTKLGAFIDEGQPGLAWVKYHRLFKILSDEDAISVEHQVVDSQQVACSPDAEDVSATETEYEYLSAALKKAATWLEVADLVERDSARLAKAVKQWSDREKNRLVDYLTSYLGSDPDALPKDSDLTPFMDLGSYKTSKFQGF